MILENKRDQDERVQLWIEKFGEEGEVYVWKWIEMAIKEKEGRRRSSSSIGWTNRNFNTVAEGKRRVDKISYKNPSKTRR